MCATVMPAGRAPEVRWLIARSSLAWAPAAAASTKTEAFYAPAAGPGTQGPGAAAGTLR